MGAHWGSEGTRDPWPPCSRCVTRATMVLVISVFCRRFSFLACFLFLLLLLLRLLSSSSSLDESLLLLVLLLLVVLVSLEIAHAACRN